MRLLTGGAGHTGPSEDEVGLFARLAARGGAVRKEEHRWVENALRLDEKTAGDLRTPRTVVETLRADERVGDLIEHAERWVHVAGQQTLRRPVRSVIVNGARQRRRSDRHDINVGHRPKCPPLGHVNLQVGQHEVAVDE